MVTLFSLAASRATIEVLQTKNVIRVAGIALSPTDLISIAFLGGVALTLYSELRAGNEFWRSPVMLAAGAFMGFALISLGYSESIGEGARGLVKGPASGLALTRPTAPHPPAACCSPDGRSASFHCCAVPARNSVGDRTCCTASVSSPPSSPNDYGFYLAWCWLRVATTDPRLHARLVRSRSRYRSAP